MPSKRNKSSQASTSRNIKRLTVFVVSAALIGLMVWQVLLTLGVTSQASYNRKGVCKPDRGGGRPMAGFTLCNVDRGLNCSNECTCVPFRNGFKFGRCMLKTEVTPTPTAVPAGTLSCGQTCETDSQCASGYCHDPAWQACPTEVPEPTQTPAPTCVPKPNCVNTRRCTPPEPASGWCPSVPQPTSTPRPTRAPKKCPVVGYSASPLLKQCRDRECFAGEQCACPMPTAVPLSPTPSQVYCTADAFECPDGTVVGRSGPNCQFVCPAQ